MAQSIDLPILPGEPLTKEDLVAVLIQWHQAPESERPLPFPGPFSGQSRLDSWLGDIATRCCTLYRPIPQQQWANAALAWIPEAGRGKYGVREQLLDYMRKKRRDGEWGMDRFWNWGKFQPTFFKVCARIVRQHRLKIGATILLGGAAVGGAACALIPAAASETTLYLTTVASGAVTRSAMGFGARHALPAAGSTVVGAIGTLGATVANAIGIGKAKERARESTEILGDIGDDGNELLGDIGDE